MQVYRTVSSIRKLFGISDSPPSGEPNGFFAKKEERDYFELTMQGFQTSEHCFGHVHTLLNVHRSRLTGKVSDENSIAKLPGVSSLLAFGSKPTANKQFDTTVALLVIAKRDGSTALTDQLYDFRLLWDKKKQILKSGCDLDMPFSDSKKIGPRVVERIEKLLLRADAFLKVEINSNPSTPPGSPEAPPSNGIQPPSYEMTSTATPGLSARRQTF
jgi:hypothetical protein